MPEENGAAFTGAAVKALSPAKINLFLAVTGRREDGYHDLVTLMCPVSMADILWITPQPASIRVACDHPGVPQNEGNLAFQAAERYFKKAHIRAGVNIVIDKKIPPGSGLGGGSSNAATVLKVLNRQYGHPLPQAQLAEIATGLGADVPFFLFSGAAVARGIGERLTPYEGLSPMSAVLVYPGFGVSTAQVFGQLNLALTKCGKKIKAFPLIRKGFDAAHHLCNDLETVTADLYPEISAVKRALMQQGASGALMSGSGSTVFGLFADPDHACRAARALSSHEPWQVHVADLLVGQTAHVPG